MPLAQTHDATARQLSVAEQHLFEVMTAPLDQTFRPPGAKLPVPAIKSFWRDPIGWIASLLARRLRQQPRHSRPAALAPAPASPVAPLDFADLGADVPLDSPFLDVEDGQGGPFVLDAAAVRVSPQQTAQAQREADRIASLFSFPAQTDPTVEGECPFLPQRQLHESQ